MDTLFSSTNNFVRRRSTVSEVVYATREPGAASGIASSYVSPTRVNEHSMAIGTFPQPSSVFWQRSSPHQSVPFLGLIVQNKKHLPSIPRKSHAMKFTTTVPAAAATATILVALVTAPRTISAWCGGSGRPYASVVRPVVVFSPGAAAEWRQRKFTTGRRSRDGGGGFTQSSPRYEITDNDSVFQVAVDVPGVSAKDLSITLEDDGHLLSIKGVRQSKTDSYSFSTRFSQSFSVDPSVDVDKFTAKLENGVLIVAAPKDLKRIEDNMRSIPITTVSGTEAAEEQPAIGKETASIGTTDPIVGSADGAEETTGDAPEREDIQESDAEDKKDAEQ
jgi:HSP20 family protein